MILGYLPLRGCNLFNAPIGKQCSILTLTTICSGRTESCLMPTTLHPLMAVVAHAGHSRTQSVEK